MLRRHQRCFHAQIPDASPNPRRCAPALPYSRLDPVPPPKPRRCARLDPYPHSNSVCLSQGETPKARRCARLCDASSCLGREVPVRCRKTSLLCATTRLGRNCLAHCPALGERGAGTGSLTCAFVGTRRSREARFSPKARYCAQASSDSRLEHGISPKARRCACPRCFLCSRALLCQRAPRHGPAALSGSTPRCRKRGPSRGRRARS